MTRIKKGPFFLSKEWAIATQDITSVTQPPFKRPVVLRLTLRDSFPLLVASFSALEELSKVQFSTRRVQSMS